MVDPTAQSTPSGPSPDPFAIFGVEPSPWLDLEVLKTRYRQLSETQHPDRAGADAHNNSADLTRAWQILSNPALRLRALLEREPNAPSWRTGQVPSEMVDTFMALSTDLKVADALIERLEKTGTQLARALLTPQILSTRQTLENLLRKIEFDQENADAQLQEVNALWQTDQSQALKQLPALYQRLSYLGKWRDQLRRRMGQLIF